VTRALSIGISSQVAGKECWLRLNEVIRAFPGECDVEFVVTLETGVSVSLGLDQWRVSVDDRLLGALEQVVGYSALELR